VARTKSRKWFDWHPLRIDFDVSEWQSWISAGFSGLTISEGKRKELSKKELQELLIKCWMAHDGAWFASCMHEYGIYAANRMNKAAIQALAPIELQRVSRALGLKNGEVGTFSELEEVLNAAFQVVKGDFMDFTFDFPEKNAFRWSMNRCFALEGMKRMGAYEQYECGVLYRVFCWLDSLGLEYTVEPPVEGCLMRETGRCSGLVRFGL
jgi:hypothetical protein